MVTSRPECFSLTLPWCCPSCSDFSHLRFSNQSRSTFPAYPKPTTEHTSPNPSPYDWKEQGKGAARVSGGNLWGSPASQANLRRPRGETQATASSFRQTETGLWELFELTNTMVTLKCNRKVDVWWMFGMFYEVKKKLLNQIISVIFLPTLESMSPSSPRLLFLPK